MRKPGIAATLYATLAGKLYLAGFFSAKLRSHQISMLPCEVEALAIATSTKHFSPNIVQLSKKACILTDSKPCVQAYGKLRRGEFSASPRVSRFLSTVSRYQASVQHVAGAAIPPSDFASHNSLPCNDMACQVCSFVSSAWSSVIRRTTTEDILSGLTPLRAGLHGSPSSQSALIYVAPVPTSDKGPDHPRKLQTSKTSNGISM